MDSSSEDCDLVGSPEPVEEATASSKEDSKNTQHLSSSTRQMRNLAEKMRRDKLNMHISDLASIVPMVSGASKRIDKTSVLRLSAAFLRINLLLSDRIEKKEWKPYFVKSNDLGGLLLEAVDGFLLVVSASGKVVYVSEGIEKTLGHSPIDLLGHSVYNVIHQDDYVLMQKQLQSDDESENQRRSFYCRMAERCLSRSECGRYDLVHVVGRIRTVEHSDNNNDGEENNIPVRESLLVSLVRLLRNQPIREISWMAGRCDEYITHHMLDGRIICADHRISLITGHLPEEVNGKSAYQYIYPKDIPVASVAHREIFSSDNGTSRTVYRLQTRGNALVYLKTQGVLQYNSSTQKVESFLCINKLLREEDGKTELHQLRIRFSPCINHPSNCNGRCDFVDSEHDHHDLPSLLPLTEQTLSSVKQWCDISELEPYLRPDSSSYDKKVTEHGNVLMEKSVGASKCITLTLYQEPVVSTSNQPFDCTSPCRAVSPSSEGSHHVSSWSDCDVPRDRFETLSVVTRDQSAVDPSNGHHSVSSTSPNVRIQTQPCSQHLPALVSARSPSLESYNMPPSSKQKSPQKRPASKRLLSTTDLTTNSSGTPPADPSVCTFQYEHGVSSSKRCSASTCDPSSSKKHRLQQTSISVEVKPVITKRRRGRPRKRPPSPENFTLC